MDPDNRNIVHLDMDTFFVSVERLQNSSLKSKPVIIGGSSDRSVVSSCSYETRSYGVHSGMPVKTAKMLCPDAIVIRGDMEAYSRYSNVVTDIIAESAPLYEKASIDEHYIDVSGMDKFFGCCKWTGELRNRIVKESGLPVSFGLSANKTVAKIATGEAKPFGGLYVQNYEIPVFLGPLSIRKIPMIGSKTFRILKRMGIDTISTLRTIPPEMMERVMGKNGKIIWMRANGIDNSPVEPWTDQKSVSSERTFSSDTTDIKMIMRLISSMIEKLCFELRNRNRLVSCVTVKIRYANFDTHTLQRKVPYTSFDHILVPVAQELFDRLYTRRMLIRMVGVRFSKLVNGVQQLDLFEEKPEMANLYMAIDRIKRRFGKGAITKAVNSGCKIHYSPDF